MSSNQKSDKPPSKTPTTTIKIAAKDPSLRTAAGAADPGPGDPSAAPSEAPQLVDIPNPPTPSELVVKSVSGPKQSAGSTPKSSAMKTASEDQKPSTGYKSAMGSTKSKSKLEGSIAGPAASHPSVSGGAPREPTSSQPLTGPTDGGVSTSQSSHHSAAGGSHHSASGTHHSAAASGKPKSASGTQAASASGKPKSTTGSLLATPSGKSKSATGSQAAGVASGTAGPQSSRSKSPSPNTASAAMQADSGNVHEDDEEGEGEVEQPETPASPSAGTGASGTAASGLRGTSQAEGPSAGVSVGAAPAQPSASGTGAPGPTSSPGSGMPSSSKKSVSGKKSSFMPSGMSGMDPSTSEATTKDGKKVTKFRYHKRITVRTSGKTSPSAIMDKVNKKDHQAGITPSTIEDMDPQELMRRAGIKGSNKTHWRVRLRQTKRLTKNGKTITQTKVAYRDSEGNKRVKTSSSPFCKTCGKKLEECKCETNSQNSQN